MKKTSVWTVSAAAMGVLGIASAPACMTDVLVGVKDDAGGPATEGGHTDDGGTPTPPGDAAPGDSTKGDGASPTCASTEGIVLATSPTGTSAAFPTPGFLGIAVDAASVYWSYAPWSTPSSSGGTGPGAIMKVSKGGGASVSLATTHAGVFFFVVAGGHVYWEDDGFLEMEATSGGTSQSLNFDHVGTGTLVADGTDLYSFGYWGDVDSFSIQSEPLGSGTLTNVMDKGALPLWPAEIMNLAVDPENVYWVGWLGLGTKGIPPVTQQGLWYVPKAGGTAQLLAAYEIQDPSVLGGLNVQPHVVADATGVYWNSPTGLMRMPSVGAAPKTLVPGTFPSFGDSIYGLAVDGTSLYWLGAGIQRVPIGGGAMTTLVHEDAVAFTVDDAFVYWINECGQIKKIAK
jgi:hypothetical protein